MSSFHSFTDKLRQELEDLPGWQAQYKMSPQFRMKPDDSAPYLKNARMGGVLIAFYPHNNDIYTVLIKRPVYKGVHSGQVAFPGGKQEEGDHDIIHTALREAEEEVGISKDSVEVLSTLTELYIPPSNFLVTPVIGITLERPHFVPQQREVDAILEVPVHQLLDEKIVGIKEVTPREGVTFNTPYFDVNGHTIWGATAMMISELNAVLYRIF